MLVTSHIALRNAVAKEDEDNEGRQATSQALLDDCLSGFKRTTMLEAKAPIVTGCRQPAIAFSSRDGVVASCIGASSQSSTLSAVAAWFRATHARSTFMPRDIHAWKVSGAPGTKWSLLGEQRCFRVSC
jgi:hypothetical protein